MMTYKLLDKVNIPDDRFEMRLSGSGGQGMIFAAVVICEAVGGVEGKNVVQSQSYGPEARGGASKSDVVISENEIFYPKAMKLDFLLAMTQEALDVYHKDLKDDGVLMVDTTLVTDFPEGKYYGIPFTRLAREEAGHAMVANVIALGAIAASTGLITREHLLDAVLARAPKGTEDKNRKAVEIGYRELEKLRTEQS